MSTNDVAAPSQPESGRTSFGKGSDTEDVPEGAGVSAQPLATPDPFSTNDIAAVGSTVSDLENTGVASSSTSASSTRYSTSSSEASVGDTSTEDGSEEENEVPEGENTSDVPQHILDTWAKTPAPATGSSEEDDGWGQLDPEIAPPDPQEILVASARKEVLEAEVTGLGLLSSLGGLKQGVATKGERLGAGGYGEVFKLEVVDSDLKKAVMDFTEGAGIVMKKTTKVSSEATSWVRPPGKSGAMVGPVAAVLDVVCMGSHRT